MSSRNTSAASGDGATGPKTDLGEVNAAGEATLQAVDTTSAAAGGQANEKEDESEASVQPSEEGSKSSTKGNKSVDSRWERMFSRLLGFKEKHGHCLVSNRYPEDPQLGSWVSTQRRQYKIMAAGDDEPSPMTRERADRLVEVGFQWVIQDPRYVPWETRYSELVQFEKQYGHAQVPIGFEQNVQLSNWVSTQRQEYKMLSRGRASRLTDDRIRLLNKVEFVWEAQRGGPRRKRKATVSVPLKPTPAKRIQPEAGLAAGAGQFAAANGLGNGLLAGQGMGYMPGMLTGVGATQAQSESTASNPTQTAATTPWQQMPNGAYQQMQPMRPNSGSVFPIAKLWPTAPPGFQYALVPNWANTSSFTQAQADTLRAGESGGQVGSNVLAHPAGVTGSAGRHAESKQDVDADTPDKGVAAKRSGGKRAETTAAPDEQATPPKGTSI